MARAIPAVHFPAFHYNKKCPEKLGTFFIFIANEIHRTPMKIVSNEIIGARKFL
jgi:hypothetical protein